jgi:hypothetical protein
VRSGPVQSELVEGSGAREYVVAPQGLFPAPLANAAPGDKVVERFRLLGRAMAKALQDARMLDMPLSYVFYRCCPAPRDAAAWPRVQSRCRDGHGV